MMPRHNRFALAGALLPLLCLTAPALAQVKVKVSAVLAAPLRQTLQLPGNLVSPQTSALTPLVEGHVTELLVEAGDRVAAGQPLLRLDDTLARLELERLEHSLREAEHVQRDSQRLAREAETLAATQNVARSKQRSLTAQAAINDSRVAQLRAAVAVQREQAGRHTLTAPFDGTVTSRQTERGQWVGTGTAVLRLTSTDPLRVDVEMPERHFGRIAPGMPVSVAAASADPVEAIVARVVPTADPVSRTFLVHIALPNPAGRLMPGMSARVVFDLDHDRVETAMQVPSDAVERKPDGSARVWIVQPHEGNTVARPVEVRTGRRAGDWVEVTSPEIGPTDRVVVQGNEGLSPNQPVVLDEIG